MKKEKQICEYNIDIEKQYEKLSEYYKDISFVEIKKEFSKSLLKILKFNPDVLTMELTTERSVFYTFIKNNHSIFIQHYLDITNANDDEAILTAFGGDSKLPSFAGSLDETLNELKEIIYSVNEIKK